MPKRGLEPPLPYGNAPLQERFALHENHANFHAFRLLSPSASQKGDIGKYTANSALGKEERCAERCARLPLPLLIKVNLNAYGVLHGLQRRFLFSVRHVIFARFGKPARYPCPQRSRPCGFCAVNRR